MKKLALFISTITLASSAFAMQWGPTLQARMGSSDITCSSPTVCTAPSLIGFGGGVTLLFPMGNRFSFRTGVLSVARSYSVSYTAPVTGTIDLHIIFTDVPLHFIWNISQMFNIHVGVNGAWWSSGYGKGTGFFASSSFSPTGLLNFYAPAQAGFGFNFGKNFNTTLFYELPTNISSTSTQTKLSGAGLTLSYLF